MDSTTTHLIHWHLLNLLPPKLLGVDKAFLARPRPLVHDDHTRLVRRRRGLHDGSALWLERLLGVPVHKTIEEGNEGVEGDIRGASEGLGQQELGRLEGYRGVEVVQEGELGIVST
jgi:hypothetical protein